MTIKILSNMKNFNKTFVVLAVCFVLKLNAQQNTLFNTYYFDPMLLNIAYAADDCIEATLNYRNQWMGIKGSPKSFQLNARTQFEKNAGLGLRISSNQAGLLNV